MQLPYSLCMVFTCSQCYFNVLISDWYTCLHVLNKQLNSYSWASTTMELVLFFPLICPHPNLDTVLDVLASYNRFL